MPVTLAPSDLGALFRPGQLVYAPGCGGESPLLVEALRQAAPHLADVTFTGVWIPGVNRIDYAGLNVSARSRLYFLAPEFRDSFVAGRAQYVPLPYTRIYPMLQSTKVDVALLHVSPPGPDGRCSLGIAADFTPAVMETASVRVAHVNPSMPYIAESPSIAWDTLEYVIEGDSPLLTFDVGGLDSEFVAIGQHIAGMIEDGATLQLGLGKAQGALLREISDRRNLRIHSGMISDPVVNLVERDALATASGAITAGVALGSDALYDLCSRDARFRFMPVGYTHDIATLSEIDGLVAVNSTIEIDLMGQCNAEMLGTRQISGAGGLVDFLRGARRAPRGRAVIALVSTAKGGTVSRIVPALARGSSVSIARADLDLVVTEHGIADLRDADIDVRAERLVAIAAPQFRNELWQDWMDMRRAM